MSAVVTDDGSEDGTAQALETLADVEVLEGDGSLYWAAGMAVAERRAVRGKPGFLLWLNDDTILDQDALSRLLATADLHPGAIVVGATRDPLSGDLTYGGRRRTSKWHVQRFERLPVRDVVQSADTFNGNAVLVPFAVQRRVGPIDDRYPHAYADDDYGLRANQLGIPILQAAGTVGACPANLPPPHRLMGLSAWRYEQQPKRHPLAAQWRFWRRHGGSAWPLILLAQEVSRVLGRERLIR